MLPDPNGLPMWVVWTVAAGAVVAALGVLVRSARTALSYLRRLADGVDNLQTLAGADLPTKLETVERKLDAHIRQAQEGQRAVKETIAQVASDAAAVAVVQAQEVKREVQETITQAATHVVEQVKNHDD